MAAGGSGRIYNGGGNPKGIILDSFGRWTPARDDPAFQPPSDPTKNLAELRARALIINREIPNVIVETGWTITDVRTAIVDLVAGQFDKPSQLQDAIAGDSRVQSAMRSRSGGLLGRAIRFKLPKRYAKDERAQKCLRAWERHWPQMHAEPALLDLLEVAGSMGFAYAQILWDTNKKTWLPYLASFNARYSWFHWLFRLHVAVTMDGETPITPGDGHWVLHAPYGSYRGWMRGALRALAQWWLARSYALRDWARYCEMHGFPLLLVDTPFGADPQDIALIQLNLQGIGQESVLQLPGSVDVTKYGKYDLRYLEPKDENWQAFKALIDQCNDEITLALLGQNLTTQVKEGSFAAARVHADVRQAILEADARALSRTIYAQILRPFAALNYGDADLAPMVVWDVAPPEDQKTNALTALAVAETLNFLRVAGYKVTDPGKFAKRFGVMLGDVEHVDPLQVQARLAGKTGEDKSEGDDDDGKGGDDEHEEPDGDEEGQAALSRSASHRRGRQLVRRIRRAA
jgi:phage gp29-like protein